MTDELSKEQSVSASSDTSSGDTEQQEGGLDVDGRVPQSVDLKTMDLVWDELSEPLLVSIIEKRRRVSSAVGWVRNLD